MSKEELLATRERIKNLEELTRRKQKIQQLEQMRSQKIDQRLERTKRPVPTRPRFNSNFQEVPRKPQARTPPVDPVGSLLDVGDMVLNLTVGALGEVAGGVSGLAALPFKGPDAGNVVEGVSRGVSSIVRKRDTTKMLLEGGGRAVGKAEEFVDREIIENIPNIDAEMLSSPIFPGNVVVETVSNILSDTNKKIDDKFPEDNLADIITKTVVKTGIFGSLELMGGKGSVGKTIETRKAKKKIRQIEKEFNVDLSGNIPDQISISADGKVQITSKGESARVVEQEVKRIRQELAEIEDARWTELRGLDAKFRPQSLREIELEIIDVLQGRKLAADGTQKGFDIKSGRKKVKSSIAPLRRAVEELRDIARRSEAGETIELRELVQFRKSHLTGPLGNVGKSKRTTKAALGVVKKEFDKFLQKKLNSDLLVGDQNALTAWKRALAASTELRSKFNDPDFPDITAIATKKLIPEQAKDLILGKAKLGLSARAGANVNKLKEILGENSSAFDLLRQEVLFDIVGPLTHPKPDLNAFVQNMNNLNRQAPTLIKNIAPDSFKELAELERVARAAVRTGKAGLDIDVVSSLARITFGHGIAKGGVRVRIATRLLNLITGANPTQRKAMMNELLGRRDPLFSSGNKSAVAAGAVVEQLLQQEEDE